LGVRLRIVFLAADDPLYLPDFFDRVLAARAKSTAAVYVVPPLYRQQTPLSAAWRYFRTFGVAAGLQLSARIVGARLRGRSIAAVCRKHRVECVVAEDVNAPEFLERLRNSAPDTIVSVSCPQVFRGPLLELPSRGVLNVHGALLPNYRGVLPGFWMLANGERQAGVSVHFVTEGLDSGDVCAQERFEIVPRESLDHFLRRSKAIAADLLVRVLDDLERGSVDRTPLEVEKGSYFSWPDRGAVARLRAAGHRLW
jgi:methionyl-tRNA formyltransferase